MTKLLLVLCATLLLNGCATANTPHLAAADYSCNKTISVAADDTYSRYLCTVGDLEFYYDPSIADVKVRSLTQLIYNARYSLGGMYNDAARECDDNVCLHSIYNFPFDPTNDNDSSFTGYYSLPSGYLYFKGGYDNSKPVSEVLKKNLGSLDVHTFYFQTSLENHLVYANEYIGNFLATRFDETNDHKSYVIHFVLQAYNAAINTEN